jgi:uncharacterized protein (DUF1697 family)
MELYCGSVDGGKADDVSSRYVALLRGVNVGKARRVAMADLRSLVEGLGYTEAGTLLNSGNVVFTAGKGARGGAAEAAARIEAGLEKKLGVASRVTVLSAEELGDIVKGNPLVDIADDHSRLLVGITQSAREVALLLPIAKQDWGPERLSLGKGPGGRGRAIYTWIPAGVIASKLNAAVGKVLGDAVTSRNWATILKLRDVTDGHGA